MQRRSPRLPFFIAIQLLAAATPIVAAPLTAALTTEQRRNLQRETLVLIELLQGYHYSNQPFHEINAGELLDRYFQALDPDRRFFLHGDTEFLRRRFERNLKTVYLFKGDLHPAFEIYDVFAKRAEERCVWIEARLNRPFLLENETLFTADRSEQPRPADSKAADALWEQILQHELIAERIRGHDADAAVAAIRRRHADNRQRVESADPLRVREYFLNALMGLFDPHCGYFSKETADHVSSDLTGAITGIGVDLRMSEGRFLVKSLQPGGPAERQGIIQPGDELLAVAKAGDTPQALASRRLREVVELIRGDPGTKLSLTLRTADGGAEKTIELERSRMEIADNHASGLLYRVPGESGGTHLIGVISLPAFYGEQAQGTTTASMTNDVKQLLAKFTARGAGAVIVDVRDNGGGLINEAVGLSGLFIEKGPALLTRGKTGQPKILRDDDPAIAFSGPLVVLTSRHSASASEGFAGAMQAYRRGLLVGGESTFGKGTMQWFIELGKAMTSIPEAVRAQWGVARVTREFFYGPDGNSPQFDGVRSDVALIGFAPPGDRREKDLPHALPHTRIPTPEPLDTTSPAVARLTPELSAHLKASAEKRISALPEFALETQADALRHQFWKTGPISLRLSVRQQEYEELNRQRIVLRRARRELDATVTFGVERIDLDVVAENRRAHQTTLLARRTADGAPLANRLERETFYYQAADNAELRAIPLENIDWEVALANASALAEAWSRATENPAGRAHPLDAVRATLTALKLREPDSPAPVAVNAIFRQQLGGALEETALQNAIGAFFKAVAELDIDVLLEHRPLDVPLRESLRLATDWIHWQRAQTGAHMPAVTPVTTTGALLAAP